MRNKLRTIVCILFACVCIVTNAASPSVERLMELPPFERAVLIIKHYETLHRPKHWPTIGYGHVVQPGEPVILPFIPASIQEVHMYNFCHIILV